MKVTTFFLLLFRVYNYKFVVTMSFGGTAYVVSTCTVSVISVLYLGFYKVQCNSCCVAFLKHLSKYLFLKSETLSMFAFPVWLAVWSQNIVSPRLSDSKARGVLLGVSGRLHCRFMHCWILIGLSEGM